ncbi:hypothetical protein LP316_11800 [Thalassotalea sp. LPB0316]|uniref:hypothetical protein n=1 Tax=Thalassotalea sp. LPB0316 TaxID=2769490 RepID=UPI0018669C63|nr:hypothetical protein [Thalassotalea sp. LPB0316]QOL24985.1 hypothetical protein LP316_11800 [Thalassotalea sp. LPB0316]
MDTQVKIIEALANGVNPLTGEILPNESLYNSPDVIRALFTALEHVKKPAKRRPRTKKSIEDKQAENQSLGLPKNAGLPWSEQQRNELAEQFKGGENVSELASVFERTNGAITAELKKQGLIDY